MRARRLRGISLMVLVLVLILGTTALAAPYGSRSLYTGRVGVDVAELQRRLNSLGYSVGGADGLFGPKTRAALTQFQKDTGLAQDGMASEWDFQALNRATAYQRATPYTVAAGESLRSIAAAHGTTRETLIWLNQLTDDSVKPGQVIRIPAAEEQLAVPPVEAPEPPAEPPSPPAGDPATPGGVSTPPPTDPGPGDGGSTTQPGPPPGGIAQPPLTPDPVEEPEPEEPQPRPGHRWQLPGLTQLDYLIIERPGIVVEQPAPPAVEKGPLVLGYYAEDWQGDSRALTSLRQAGTNLDMVVNFQMAIDATGTISTREYPELMAEAKIRGLKVHGLVHNFAGTTFDRELARALLSSPEARRRAVDQMLVACRTFGLAGIDIDIENVPADQRENYTALIREMSERLKPEGYGVSVSIPAKTFDDRTSAWSGAFDYQALGQYADKVAIMAYDESTPGFPAGPVASVGWVERVAAFASSQIEPKKVLLGIASYGYDWIEGTTQGRGLSAPQAEALAAKHGATILWHDTAQVPYFTYLENGKKRIVYYENGASTGAKLELVAKYNLGGIAVWRLGLEDPSLWSVIEQKLR